MAALSFEQWQATRKAVTLRELRAFTGDDLLENGGFTYDGGCWIETYETGEHSVIIGNGQVLEKDLTKAERHLYDTWYVCEADDPEPRCWVGAFCLTMDALQFEEVPEDVAREVIRRCAAFRPLLTLAQSMAVSLADQYSNGPDQAASEKDVPADTIEAWRFFRDLKEAKAVQS